MINSEDLKYRRFWATIAPAGIGILAVVFASNGERFYGQGLFVWLPFVLSSLTVLIYSYKTSVTKRQVNIAVLQMVMLFAVGLIASAVEGAICLLMASPLMFAVAYIGTNLTLLLVKRNPKLSGANTPLILLVLSIPIVMGFERALESPDNLIACTTSVEIAAPAETVWKNVISFPTLPPPNELLFKVGVAYPIDAKIDGSGVGAIRHCNFSTGSFVEPITVWDAPHRLAFSVEDQPEPMKELSPYEIHPTHLHGYFVSKHGEFRLTTLANGHTLLEGTTWYVNKIKPNLYWNLWSNYIVHAIHTRVLEHIKNLSER